MRQRGGRREESNYKVAEGGSEARHEGGNNEESMRGEWRCEDGAMRPTRVNYHKTRERDS